jgi:hypothetical protein
MLANGSSKPKPAAKLPLKKKKVEPTTQAPFIPTATAILQSAAAKSSAPALGTLSRADIEKMLGSKVYRICLMFRTQNSGDIKDTSNLLKNSEDKIEFGSVMARRIHDLVLQRGSRSKPPDFSRMKYSFYLDRQDPDTPRKISGPAAKKEEKDEVFIKTIEALKRIEKKKMVDEDMRTDRERDDLTSGLSEDDFDIFDEAGREYSLEVSKRKKESQKSGDGKMVEPSHNALFLDERLKEDPESRKDPNHLLHHLEVDHEFFNTEIIDESDDDFNNEFGEESKKKDEDGEKELSRFHFETEEEYIEYKGTLKRKSGKQQKKTKTEK